VLTCKRRPIPEHFIWHFLSEMTHALEAFQTGNCAQPRTIKEDPDHDLDETPEWQPLLHSDIKLLNIFCCDQNTVYQSYPRPVLADFDRVHTQESADKMRYEGTRDWQPPQVYPLMLLQRSSLPRDRERYSDCAGDKAYAPHLSPLTVASDIWGVGLIGCRMMWAGEGEKVYNSLRVDLRKTMDTWSQQFKRDEWDNNMGNEGLIDASFPNTPGLYSFGLIRFLQRCLRYKPENRPSLAEMRTTIAENIARLDGLYGDEIMKPKGEIFQHHVVLTDGVPALDALDAFAMGQQYEPPRKRRRINVENEDVATYRQFIAEWVSMESSGPQPSVKQQTEIIENLAKCGRESQTDAIRQSVEYGSLRHTYAYLYNCLLSRVRSEGPYTARRNDIEEEFEESVEPQAKIHVLECLRDHIIPELLDDETIKEDLQPALRVLEHVVRLTLFLQSVNGEPLTPVYPNKTELHRGFVDWLFINPIPGKA
jgi:serine/threonine protein kinase